GVPIPPIMISTPNSSTGTASQDTAGTGIFCTPQANAGCFGSVTCDYISETGSPAGMLTPGTHAAKTSAIFCVPGTGNGLVDPGASLPGPGANSTPQSFQLLP